MKLPTQNEREPFKSIHKAAPLLFKRIDRVEASMFVFFLAMMVQAIIERLVRQRLNALKMGSLKLYPEDRDAPHPTTSQILKTFEGLNTYRITRDGQMIEEYRDRLTNAHRRVLDLLGIEEEKFWGNWFERWKIPKKSCLRYAECKLAATLDPGKLS